jgi:xanthine dehydrogenase accessory factor
VPRAGGGAAVRRPAGGARGVLESALSWRSEGRDVALVAVTHSEGSTYRKAGAIAAVTADGRRAGSISGGCLEPSVEQLALDAIAAGAPRSLVLDTRRDDDLVFGSGSGCRGRMHVVALPERTSRVLDGIAQAWTAGRAATLSLPDGAELPLAPPARLLLIGAGPAAAPLASLGRSLGWRVTVADHREALLERVVDADRCVRARPAQALSELLADRPHAVIVMTHGAETDLEALRALSATDVARLGLLGPPARRDELLARLTAPERDALLPRLRAPAGLRLGGEGPEAIALSIAAELQRSLHPEA